MPHHCDIFCDVIDHFGDIGFCWRLSQSLEQNTSWLIRLWINDMSKFKRLAKKTNSSRLQVMSWDQQNISKTHPASIVIAAFSCQIPSAYLEKMRTQDHLWINLEYLSAETWTADFHGKPSKKASSNTPSPVYFFPGFDQETGGLLQFIEQKKPTKNLAEHLRIFMFCYPSERLEKLIQIWSNSTSMTHCFLADPIHLKALSPGLGLTLEPGQTFTIGNLTLNCLPYLTQKKFDALMQDCDVIFCRGEDSFLQSQWLSKPVIWHIYPQTENIHEKKLQAFLSLYTATLTGATKRSLTNLWHNWNNMRDPQLLEQDWQTYQATLPQLATHAQAWTKKIEQLPKLTSKLIEFININLPDTTS